ncbi:MAG TPA: cell envelope integrity protein TolA [Candidatus Binatia bacterium]|jgi:colicin import membrane protein
MAKSQLKPLPYLGRPEGPSEGLPRAWKWIILSGIAHVVVVTVLLIAPIFGPKDAPPPPVYTVDLMGGEKLGAGAGTSLKPMPAPKPEPMAPEEKSAPPVQETKKAKEPPKPTAQEIKEAKAKAAADARAEMVEKVKAKKEAEEKRRKEADEKRLADEKAVAERRARLEDLNKKRKEAALADLRAKLEERQRQQALEEKMQQQKLQEQQRAEQQRAQQQATSTISGNNPGAATSGPGVGMGGGIQKSPEYIRYRNEMEHRIQDSFTWPGLRNDLTVLVRYSIQDSGEITSVRITKSSGDRSFDDAVIRAIKKASPLPPLPDNLKNELREWEYGFNAAKLRG